MSVLVYDCGSVENTVTAILDTESGAMIIRGNGDVDNYMNEYSPWYSEHSNITQLTVDKGITRIGSGTFYGCENLSFVEIANTVTSIGTDVFKNCTALSRIKIPKTITNISNGAFADSRLTEIKFYGNPPTVGTDIFDGVTADVYTPEGNEEWTETAKGTVAGNGSNLTWKEFDSKPNLIEYDELDYLWSKIKKYVDNNVSVTPVLTSGTKIATITVNGVDTDLYSSTFSGTVGNKLKPVYINNGVPTECDDLKYPDGEILNLNAKGLTTSSIAEVDGVIDSSGYDNHGQAFGGVTVVNDSKTGQCYSFDGVDDYLETIKNVDITQEITYSFWINVANFTSKTNNCIIWHASTSETITGIDLYLLNSGLFQFDNRNPNINTYSINPISVNTWYHIVITANATETKIYINSTLDCSNNHGITEHLNTYKLRIGQAVGTWFTNCKILNFRIYPRVLSASEIKTLYTLGSKSTYAGNTYHAATATTASKLSNTTQIGNVSTPVYINANGVPTVCNKFASASIGASDSTKTPAGWFRIFSLTGYENGIIIVGGGGYGVSAPCYAILSFSISNNKPNISLISSGNTTTGAGGSTTKIRITCSTSARYVEAYNNPTEQTRNQFFRIFTNESSATGYNITAGSSPNGEELTYTATVDINKNTEPCLHTTDTAIGSASKPIYVDKNGVVQVCTSVDLTATTASACSGNAATSTKTTVTVATGGTHYGIATVPYSATSGTAYGITRLQYANSRSDADLYFDANNASGTQRVLLMLGNQTAITTAAGKTGQIVLWGTGTTQTTIAPANPSSNNTVTLPTGTGTLALTSSNITGSASKWGGYALSIVTALPSSPNANTIYLVK